MYWSSEPSQFWDRWAQARASLGRCLGSFTRMGEAACGERGVALRPLCVCRGWNKGLRVPLYFFSTADKEQVPLLKIQEPPTVAGRIAEVFTDLLTRRPLAQATHNFLRGFSFHKDYFQHPHFSAWKGTCSSPPAPCSPRSSHGHLSLGFLIRHPLSPVPQSHAL